ncbi:RimJ/RimL family protein N-acetyltransferase [Rhizobium sp. BK529]|uniref:GNAT family N-acetyltransferase n=1 Tax=unclassified Rhizobium TaxID=2613769 RepID=UPI0010517CC8|nr:MULTISPECIES: GNAT family N-acetyltransferase [unclassified Rhizobium]MBB3591142.1 RimJ/RimL family protein N-acetyltransferase [Rhizobium sp. BK529]TCS08903.1 RimJ/RimL family protein N-acetyltransferase [Rhizobium sp. BK418]
MSGEVIFETPRLVAQMWEDGDADLIHDLHLTIETTRYMSGAASWSREKAEERLRSYLTEQARDGTTKYKMLSREDGRYIGRAGISLFHTGEYELGYAFYAREWGKGYATEIAAGLADWFFAKGIAQHFVAFTHPDNLVSQHILKKIGMRERGPIFIEGVQGVEFEITAAMRQAVT